MGRLEIKRASDEVAKVAQVMLSRLDDPALVREMYLDPEIEVPQVIRDLATQLVRGEADRETIAARLVALTMGRGARS